MAHDAMKALAIIPARGGSKGIPGKNLRLVAGRPLLVHSIHAALHAQHVGRVIVSTDDPQIAQVGREAGAEVVLRPAELSGDTASSEAALLHVLGHLESTEGRLPRVLAFLQCTSPLTAAEDIDGTLGPVVRGEAETAVAVVPFHYFLWRRNEQGEAFGVNHEKSVRLMRQQRPPEFLEAGAVYAMQVEGFRTHKHRFFGRTALYEMPAERRWEIDDPVDLEVAQVLLRHEQRAQRARMLPRPLRAMVMDFDGVFTDNRVIVDQQGVESVTCDRGDGMGLNLLKAAGLPLLVVSKERNPVVLRRCEKLGIACLHGIDDKPAALRHWFSQQGIDPRLAVYVGNDVNDLGAMAMVGCPVAVADAHERALAAARLVLMKPGGRGALRELADLILTSGVIEPR